MEREMERKLISQAAKNFNIHLHMRNLKKENQVYLDKLSNQVSTKLKLYINPIKYMKYREKQKIKNELDTSDSYESSSSSHSDKPPVSYLRLEDVCGWEFVGIWRAQAHKCFPTHLPSFQVLSSCCNVGYNIGITRTQRT